MYAIAANIIKRTNPSENQNIEAEGRISEIFFFSPSMKRINSGKALGVDTPEMKGTSDEVKALAKEAQQRTEKALQGASKIELRNPQRGKYFRIVSEVWIDGESLADMLKANGLAKDYDGEGARPEW